MAFRKWNDIFVLCSVFGSMIAAASSSANESMEDGLGYECAESRVVLEVRIQEINFNREQPELTEAVFCSDRKIEYSRSHSGGETETITDYAEACAPDMRELERIVGLSESCRASGQILPPTRNSERVIFL